MGTATLPHVVDVAIDEGPLHGPRTGIGNAVASIVDGLASERPDVSLLPYVTSTRAHVQSPTRRLPVPAALAHRWWARASRPQVDRWLGRPDVVHGTNYVVPPTRCPCVVSVYDCWFLDRPELASGEVARAGAVLRRAIGDGAHVVTSSAATTDRVRELLGTGEVTTVHLGPPPPLATARLSPRLDGLSATRYVLAMGTTERRKNLPTLVRAFERLAREVHNVQLVMAGGNGDDEDTLQRAISRLPAGSRDRIVRLGRVTEDERSWLLDNAAVLAYPSLDEGFGFPVLEAQRAGVPVVTTPVGSIPEVAGSAALYGSPDDVDALAANIHLALTNTSQVARLVERGRANLERFDWTATVNAYVDLYERLADR